MTNPHQKQRTNNQHHVGYRALALTILLAISPSHAFTLPITTTPTRTRTPSPLFALPPMIIGPMIRKMREAKAKKNQPLCTSEEASLEGPGLKVGSGVWNWPPVWPYAGDTFIRREEVESQDGSNPMNMMMNTMAASAGGMDTPQAPKVDILDVVKYWGEDVKDETTALEDEESAEALRNHYSFYLKDGMSILEFGAGEESYFPSGLKAAEVIGAGLSTSQMTKNPSLTSSLTVDLNDVTEEVGLNAPEIAEFGEDRFDAVVMANSVDYLTNPREVFRSAWKLLKPGGILITSFSSKDYTTKFVKAQTKMWNDYNDDQHMYVVGSFYQFSAGEGWDGLKGFDVSPENAKNDEGGFMSQFQNADKGLNMYVVQATKKTPDEVINKNDPTSSFKSRMWVMPELEDRDKELIAPRMATVYQILGEGKNSGLVDNIDTLPKIYGCLIRMDQFAFPFDLQAQLATNLISDQQFTGSDEQIAALKMGLGLKKPTKEFWAPIGLLTVEMSPQEKIDLLAYIIPRVGSESAPQEESLKSFVTGLKPTFSTIRSKCPNMKEGDVQLLGTELLASEILKPGGSTREQFAQWLTEIREDELTKYLEERKSIQKNALQKSDDYKRSKKEEQEKAINMEKEIVEKKEKLEEERTMFFNEKTGRMEEIKKKK